MKRLPVTSVLTPLWHPLPLGVGWTDSIHTKGRRQTEMVSLASLIPERLASGLDALFLAGSWTVSQQGREVAL